MKQYAGFVVRAFAQITDMLVTLTVGILAVFFLSLDKSQNLEQKVIPLIWTIIFVLLINGLIFFVINAYLISHFGGTLGKLLFGIKIEHPDGSKLTLKRAFFREYIAKFPTGASFGLGYMTLFKTEHKQTWHDMLSDTVVVRNGGIIQGIIAIILLLILVTYLLFAASNNILNSAWFDKNNFESRCRNLLESTDPSSQLRC